ncbi:MAG: beta-galactosidase, partial [Umezawaea sp.]
MGHRSLLALLSVLALVVACLGGAGPAAALPGAPAANRAHTVTYDDYSFLVDGKRTYLWAGEFHYYRLPSPDLWRDIFQKMRAAGFNSTSLYFDWGYHSPSPGVYDFTGVRDVDRLLDIAEEEGLYVIARPGPYINAEVDGGGFPTWLSTKPGNTRSADPVYLAYSDEWQTEIDRVIKRHQITDGGGSVIAYQVENEFYNNDAAGRTYIAHIRDKARADGIAVPLTGNNNGKFNSGVGALDVDGPDSYPQGFNCSNPTSWRGVPDISYAKVPGKPLFSPEFQGGAFDAWGGPGYPKCAQLINDQFASVFSKQNIAVGATAQSFYMLYGGTSWGWNAIPQNYTSYDYGAAITESRQFDAKYYEDKLIGYFTQAVAPLTKTDKAASAPLTDASLLDTARTNPDTRTQFHTLRHTDSTSNATSTTSIALDVAGANGSYPTVPQQSGTGIVLDGRQSKIVVAGYDLGRTRMQYSTSEIMTHAAIAGRDVAVLYGDKGQAGETVLRYAEKPTVAVLGGSATSTWDAARGDLRLNYTHDGLTRVLVTAAGKQPLLLLLGDKQTAATFWRQDTASGPALVRGTHLVRTAKSSGSALALTGDVGDDGSLEVFSLARQVSWNGRRVPTQVTSSGSRAGVLGLAAPVTLPALTGWKHQQESPESRADFDDSTWPVADKMTTNSKTTPGTLPVLFADDYGFHTGNTWYRGRFTSDGKQTGITLSAQSGGSAGAFSAWLNGTFLGSSTTSGHAFTFPPGALVAGGNVLSVLTVNMGHNDDYTPGNGNKAARGLTSARLLGSPLTSVTWRLQGTRGGEDPLDTVRGPLNTGGLYGERAGWSLPKFPDSSWSGTTLPATDPTPGVSWYRTNVKLDLPRGQDTSLGLTITDDPARQYRALIFVNGWQMGQYVNYLGPQHSFPIPNGVLDPRGNNTIAIAVWNLDGSTGGLGAVSLTNYGSYASPLSVARNSSPAYRRATYAIPAAPKASVSLGVPNTFASGQRFTATATVRVPAGASAARDVTATLAAPEGWTVGRVSPASVAHVDGGRSVVFSWPVTAPSGTPAPAALRVRVNFVQQNRKTSVSDSRILAVAPAAPPSGQVEVSGLPFLLSASGWGPVERDTSNGEAAAGDGKPLTIAGTVHPKGLGAHADSDVQVFLGGKCSRFTALVGVDDETGGAGSVTFSVVVDGVPLTTTPVLRGRQAPVAIDLPITGDVLDLVVGDGGDGNG